MRSLHDLSIRSLSKARARTVLSALAVATGVAVLTSSSVFNSGVRAAWESGENKMSFVIDFGSAAFTATGGLLMVAAGFLIYNAFAMSLAQRRREVGLLRSLGMTPHQVTRMVLFEVGFTGGLGTLIGLVAGPLLGNLILSMLGRMGMEVSQGQLSPGGIALAVAMGMGITLLSALLPAQAAGRTPPIAALQDPGEYQPNTTQVPASRRQVNRSLLGLSLIGTLWTYLLIAPPGRWSTQYPPMEWVLSSVGWGIWLAGILLLSPALIAGAIRLLRKPMIRLGGTVGRLTINNLERSPNRVTLTAITFAVGLMILVGGNGEISFLNDSLVGTLAENALAQTAWYIYPFDRKSGLAQLSGFDQDAPGLETEVVRALEDIAQGRALLSTTYLVSPAEISAPFPGFPSFLVNLPEVERLSGPNGYRLQEGDWKEILAWMKLEGCTILVSPPVATRNQVSVGDSLTVTGLEGPVECRVAGLGAGDFIPVTIIGPGAKDLFVLPGKNPDTLTLRPLPGSDWQALETDLLSLQTQHPQRMFISLPDDELRAVTDTSDQLMTIFNGMVFLGILGATLGMVNSMLVSVLERKREFGLLRAVGASRQQLVAVIMGEAALTALLGALLGTLMGFGMGSIFALVFGGGNFGLAELDLRQAALETLLPGLKNSWWAILAAPLLASAAVFPVVRRVLQGAVMDTLMPERS